VAADRGNIRSMPKQNLKQAPLNTPARVRRGYFECRYGQLHVHNAMPSGGGFEEGTPLLCLHDCPGSGRSFAPFLALAGRDRSVYAPDLPGFGESDAPVAPPQLQDYVGADGDFLDTMRLRRVDLFGTRAGALIGAELAIARGTQIGRVVLLSAPVAAAGERVLSAAPPAQAPAWERHLLESLARYPARERLARLTQKLLVLRPKDDLAEATARIREVLPAARVQDLELAGSELLARAPQRLIEAVRDFLRA
jgi:pimeloyl-ACP methyl ester carboxylesterase